MKIHCPHCAAHIGGPATEGGLRVRLGIVLVDPSTGLVKGPCPVCKGEVVIAEASTLSKSMQPLAEPGAVAPPRRRLVPGIRLHRP